MHTKPPLSQAGWERPPAEAQASIRALEARVAVLAAPVQPRLERRRMDAHNSSQPPSRALAATSRPRQRRPPSGRKPGGQPGHHGQTRALVPRENVEAVLPVTPTPCVHCQPPVHGEDGQPQRHQVTEVPPVQPVVTAYPLHALVCPACGAPTRAKRPVGVPTGGFGPRVPATVARCTGAYRLSKRTTQEVRADLVGRPRRLGTMPPLEPASVPALAAPGPAAHPCVRAPPLAPLDATGGRAGRGRAWLWVAGTTWGTVLVVRLSRGAQVAAERVGARCSGILVTDRWRAYPWYPTRGRHVGWAPRRRALAAMRERGGRSQELGDALRAQAQQMLHAWHQVRAGTRTHAPFRVLMRRHGARLLKAGQTCGVAKTAGVWRARRKVYEALGTCGRVAGVAPTNQAAERAIRPGVLGRPGRFGTQRAAGARFVEAMMTVVATRKQQPRHVRTEMTDACQAASMGMSAPSLLPRHTEAKKDLPIVA